MARRKKAVVTETIKEAVESVKEVVNNPAVVEPVVVAEPQPVEIQPPILEPIPESIETPKPVRQYPYSWQGKDGRKYTRIDAYTVVAG